MEFNFAAGIFHPFATPLIKKSGKFIIKQMKETKFSQIAWTFNIPHVEHLAVKCKANLISLTQFSGEVM